MLTMPLRGLLALLLASLALPWAAIVEASPPSAVTESSEDTQLLVVGDSLGAGWGALEPQRGGFAPRLVSLLTTTDRGKVNLLNLSVAGETSDSLIGDFFQNPASHAQLARAVAELKARATRRSLIVVEIGANDLLVVARHSPDDGERHVVFERFAHNFDRILAALTDASGGRVQMVTMTYYDPLRDQAGLRELSRLNQTIRDVAARHQVPVAHVYERFAGHETFYTWTTFGDIHPTDWGYQVIALAIAETVDDPNQPRAWATVTGRAHDARTGAPVEGAEVYFGGGLATSDATGHFILPRVLPVERPLLFAASARGYLDSPAERIQVAPDQTATLTFALQPSPSTPLAADLGEQRGLPRSLLLKPVEDPVRQSFGHGIPQRPQVSTVVAQRAGALR